jgi:hypothetical protein
MVARGFVEGRRSAMPDVNLSDKEIAAEDRAARAKSARACELHLADLIRYHSAGRKSASGRPRKSPPVRHITPREHSHRGFSPSRG